MAEWGWRTGKKRQESTCLSLVKVQKIKGLSSLVSLNDTAGPGVVCRREKMLEEGLSTGQGTEACKVDESGESGEL